MILTHTRHSLGGKSNNIHGILFDVAWLWEEYLNTIFKDDFIHPRNKQNSGGIAVFVDGKRIVYPDFYNKKIDMIVDAKYKDLTDQSISREDLYQIISYTLPVSPIDCGE